MATRAAVTRVWVLKTHKILYNVKNSENMGPTGLKQDSELGQTHDLNFSGRHLTKTSGLLKLYLAESQKPTIWKILKDSGNKLK